MCNNCNGNLKLISFRWNKDNKEMVCKYKCEECNKIQEIVAECDDDKLKSMVYNPDLYNNL